MVARRRNATTTLTPRRSREPVVVLRRVLVSGPITALAASTQGYTFWEAHVWALRGTQGGSART